MLCDYKCVCYCSRHNCLLEKGDCIPLQVWTGPCSRGLRLPGFLDSLHMKVAKFSALNTGRLYAQGDTRGTHFLWGWVDPRTIVQSEGLSKRKISMKTSGTEPLPFRLVAQCLSQLWHRITQLCINTVVISYNCNGDVFRSILRSSSGQYSHKLQLLT